MTSIKDAPLGFQPRKHYFSPSDDDCDFCSRCCHNFRNANMHCKNDERPETDAQYIARLEGYVSSYGVLLDNMRTMAESFAAMRNDLSEVFPIQSEEADLLQGPEFGHQCTVIVEAARAAWNTRAPTLSSPDREKVARIIAPMAFAKYDAELANDRHADNGRRWADVVYGDAINDALHRADDAIALILSTLAPDEAAIRADDGLIADVSVALRNLQAGGAKAVADTIEILDRALNRAAIRSNGGRS